MATVAQIVISMDEKGAVASLNNLKATASGIDPALQKVGQRGNVMFTEMSKSTEKARESAMLFAETTGVHLPRALAKVLAHSSMIGPALNAAFSISAAVAFAAFLVDVASRIGEFTSKISSAGQDMKVFEEAVTKTSRAMQGPQTFTEMAARVLETTKRIEELRQATGRTGDLLPGLLVPVRRLGAEFRYSSDQLERLEKDLPGLQDQLDQLADRAKRTDPVTILKLQNQTRLEGLKGIAQSNEAEVLNTQVIQREVLLRTKLEVIGQAEITLEHAKAATARRELERNLTNQLRDLHAQAGNAELSGIVLLNAQQMQDVKKTHDALEQLGLQGVQLEEEFQKQKTEIDAKYTALRLNLIRDEAGKGMQAVLQAQAARVDGVDRIAIETHAKELAIAEDERRIFGISDGQLTAQREAASSDMNNKLLDLARQRAEDETQIEIEAAIAMLPSWRRADAQLVADVEARIKKIRDMEAKDNTFRVQGEREVSAIIQKEWHDRVESMANQLEGLYNEITTGGIGQFFLQRFKHMLFEMVASWIVGMRQMRAASQQQMGSGGGILGAIFGSLGLGGIFGGGGGGGGGGQSGVSGIPGVITNLFGGRGSGEGALAGGGESSSSSPMGISAGGGFTAGGILPAGAGPAGSLFGGGLPGIAGGGGLAGMAGLGLLAMSFRRGGVLGALGGAAGGALMGFLYGGPIGAIIGGIIGLIMGIAGKSTKKARLAIEADIKAKSQAVEDSYNLFQSDWTSSRTALEALRQQGVDALKQAGVKDIARSRVGHVDQWIDKAEKEIDRTQAERNRRAALTFGPPEFRVGGLVGPGFGAAPPAWFAAHAMHFSGGGAVPAILHEGEFVMRPEAVSRIGPGKLASMNSGGGSGGDIHVTINAIDASSFKEFLSRKGGVEIIKFFAQARNEGML
jgi:gas vesicle protein